MFMGVSAREKWISPGARARARVPGISGFEANRAAGDRRLFMRRPRELCAPGEPPKGFRRDDVRGRCPPGVAPPGAVVSTAVTRELAVKR